MKFVKVYEETESTVCNVPRISLGLVAPKSLETSLGNQVCEKLSSLKVKIRLRDWGLGMGENLVESEITRFLKLLRLVREELLNLT